ncbi:MAG: 4Fe-4S dicluster domain-containing protein [Candidatus Sericytochromatia bacterium]|nr:4Fe-4S dicluster domain-containing protein [Candidatus Tanganyikabacteria bacterium]
MLGLPEGTCPSGGAPCGTGGEPPPAPGESLTTRREFLAISAGFVVGLATAGCTKEEVEAFFQRNFRELSPEEVKKTVARLEAGYEKRFSRKTTVSIEPAQEGVVFGYGLDLSRCIGCRRCAYACQKENNQSRDPQIQWIRVLQQERSKGVDLEGATPYYDAETVPQEGMTYIPVACQQCAHPQCTKVCPVGATWQEPDGIVVIDYDWCIGCRCCMAACPYDARRFNFGEPNIPPAEYNPDTHYLGNRPRPQGVVEKCTWCIQRVRKGRYPACVEICPVGARKFGNLLDPESEIRKIMDQKRVFVLKSEMGTDPKFYYFYTM